MILTGTGFLLCLVFKKEISFKLFKALQALIPNHQINVLLLALFFLTNNLSDHCAINARNTEISCSKPGIITKRNLKLFNEQTFLQNLYSFSWGRIKHGRQCQFTMGIFIGEFYLLCGQECPFLPGQSERSGQPLVQFYMRETRPEQQRESLDLIWLCFHQLCNWFTASIRKTKCD